MPLFFGMNESFLTLPAWSGLMVSDVRMLLKGVDLVREIFFFFCLMLDKLIKIDW